jgi:sulfate adenylyltransferase subunit 1 (EFTu-like GTPase family)
LLRALPSGQQAVVDRIVTYDGDLEQAFAPMSVTLKLDREIDLSRGDVLINAGEAPPAVRRQL